MTIGNSSPKPGDEVFNTTFQESLTAFDQLPKVLRDKINYTNEKNSPEQLLEWLNSGVSIERILEIFDEN